MQSLRDDVLLKLMLLEYSNEQRFRELAGWHAAQKQTPKEIIAMEKGDASPKDWERDSLQRWIQMEPKLSEVDLSDYFWLVRDRLESSLLGLSLVPPIVKVAYAALLSETGRKQAEATIKQLREDEVDTLVVLLTKHAQRDPKDAEVYSAFLELIDLQPRKMTLFAKLIKELPSISLPGWLTGKLELLAKSKAALKPQVTDLVEYLASQKGPAAKAAQLKR
jgi:hypothetical protein